MTSTPTWNSLRDRWPNAAASRFVDAAGLRWHVQSMGHGPAILLLHGSGAATHTWHALLPRLAERFTAVACDLPGHGLTTGATSAQLSLHGIASLLHGLLDVLELQPAAIVGHSAGAAVAMELARARPPRAVVGINAALTPPNALLHVLSLPVQALARTPLLGALTATLAGSDWVFDSLMRSTGSRLTPAQHALYRTFARSSDHAGAVMTMFANWDLAPLVAALPSIAVRTTLIVGADDGWIPPDDTRHIASLLPHARVMTLTGAGHLAHEDRPDRVAEIIAESLPPT